MRHLQLLDDYCNYVGLNRTPSTVYVHRTKLGPLFKFWEHLEPKDFTRAEFEKYLHYGNTVKKWKPRTMQIYLDCARGFIRWAAERDMGIPDFAKGIKKPRVHRSSEVIYYTEGEAQALLMAAGTARVSIVVALGFFAGARRTEIYNADWKDVDWDGNRILIHGSKTYHDRWVMLSPTLRKVLRSHWRGQKKGRVIGDLSPAWKDNIRRDMRRLCKRAGVEYKAIHALRRGFATTAMLKGAAPSTIMKLGGWKNLATVTRYAGTDDESMQAAVDLLG